MTSVLYICYEAITEPLVETQVLSYLRGLAQRGHTIHLLTFEKESSEAAEERRIADRLASDGIIWHHLRYHRWPTLLATGWDAVTALAAAAAISWRHRITLVHGRSHVAAMVGLQLRSLGVVKRVVFDCRGLLAEEYADAGHWKRQSLPYRLTMRGERSLFRHADAVVVLSSVLARELRRTYTFAGRRLVVIPCCVSREGFEGQSDRARIRRERNWEAGLVCAYVGKLGGWYPVELIAGFFAALRARNSAARLYVATQSDPSALLAALTSRGVPSDAVEVETVPPSRLPFLLSASDVGLSLIRPCPSKRASSPTKVGEYLAAGLPVVSTVGIGDCDALLDGVGVIVGRGEATELIRAANEVATVLTDPAMRDRCRSVAERELALDTIGVPRYDELYRDLDPKVV